MRRATLLLAPTTTDDPKAGKSREKSHFLSLKSEIHPHCDVFAFKLEKKTISFCLIHLNFSKIPSLSLSLDFLTHGLI